VRSRLSAKLPTPTSGSPRGDAREEVAEVAPRAAGLAPGEPEDEAAHSSLTMRPSLRVTTRSGGGERGVVGDSTRVLPRRGAPTSSSMICLPVAIEIAGGLVGQEQGGRRRARAPPPPAAARRPRAAPGSDGRARRAQPRRASAVARVSASAGRPARAAPPRSRSRSGSGSGGRTGRRAHVVAPEARERVLVRPVIVTPAHLDAAPVGWSSPAISPSRVDLPLPDGAGWRRIPGRHLERHVGEHGRPPRPRRETHG